MRKMRKEDDYYSMKVGGPASENEDLFFGEGKTQEREKGKRSG